MCLNVLIATCHENEDETFIRIIFKFDRHCPTTHKKLNAQIIFWIYHFCVVTTTKEKMCSEKFVRFHNSRLF